MSHSAANVDVQAGDGQSALRAICKAVIRRVCEEHPESVGYELFLRLWAASPFGRTEGPVQQLWFEEVLHAIGGLETLRRSLPSASLSSGGRRRWLQ